MKVASLTLGLKCGIQSDQLIRTYTPVEVHARTVCCVCVFLSSGVHSLPAGCLWCSWLSAAPGNTLSPPLCWRSRRPPPRLSGPSTGRSPCRQLQRYSNRSSGFTGLYECVVRAVDTHGDTKFFCMRKAEMPQSFHSTWWCAQSSATSISVVQWCFHSDEKRGAPSPYRLRLQGRWVSAVTTSGSLCLIWAGVERSAVSFQPFVFFVS